MHGAGSVVGNIFCTPCTPDHKKKDTPNIEKQNDPNGGNHLGGGKIIHTAVKSVSIYKNEKTFLLQTL